MDVSSLFFSSNSQTLTLLSHSPLLPSASLHPSRRQFLGCRYNFRPPGASLWKKRRKLGILQFRTPGVVVRASLTSNSVLVVVALTALSAVSIFYYRQFQQKYKRIKEREVPVSSNVALSEQVCDGVNQSIQDEILDFRDSQNGTCSKENKDTREWANASQDKEVHLQFQESGLINDVAVLSEKSESLDSNASDAIFRQGGTSTQLVVESSALQPVMSKEMSELQSEKGQKQNSPAFDVVVMEANCSSRSVFLDEDGSVDAGKKLSSVTNGVATVYNDVFRDTSREELHTFYKTDQPVAKSLIGLNGFKQAALHASFPNSNSFSSPKRNPRLRGAALPGEASIQISDNDEGRLPVSKCKRGSPHERKDMGKGRGLSNEKERRHLIHENDTNESNGSFSNGALVNAERPSQERFSSYNNLLRDGRLADCVDFLEDMERRGLLDMDKIYHAKFFKICKIKKAVNEAFRFTKLIPNPTMSTFNMLMSVCASSQDSDGAFQVMQLVQEARMKADCKLYTTLISTCAKSGKVDTMFEVFHEMVNAGVEPNVHTYGALIDGCAKAGQVAKAFGAYGIMRSKNVKPDRAVFNALITACGQSGAVDRAFDVLSEMRAEAQPIDPDHITVGALIKACANAGQVDRAWEVYKMIHEYNIKGTAEVYTIAINCCSQIGDWEFACSVYSDMKNNDVAPDEVFISALLDVAGHAGKLDAAFEILQEAKMQGMHLGIVSYSSLMGACSNAKNWQKALQLYETIKSIKLNVTVSTVNALITVLCEGDQLPKAMEILSEMKGLGLCPDIVTYSVLLVASEKKDDLEVGLMLLSEAKENGIAPNLIMYRCIIGMCLRRFEKSCSVGEPVLSFNSGRPQIESKWTSLALKVYREVIVAGTVPTMEVISQILGCLQLPRDASLKGRLIEDLGVSADSSRKSSLVSLIDGFGEYDPRAFSLLEEAASLGIVPCISFKEGPIAVDARKLDVHTAQVYLLTIIKGLKHRLAAGAKLPSVSVLLPLEQAQIMSPEEGKTINLAGRVAQSIAALLRRIGLPFQGNGSYGKIRITGLALKRWLQPKIASPFSGKPGEWNSSQMRLGRGISYQQRNIRTNNLSLD